MFVLQKVFSDGALFQADSRLVLKGLSDKSSNITAKIIKGEKEFCYAAVCSDDSGSFTLELKTPSASFEKCKIILQSSVSGENYTVNDVLFGELWLASGQSNMELTNAFENDAENMIDSVRGKNIRVYHVDYPAHLADGTGEFPWEPEPMNTGRWIASDDRESLKGVSSLGLKFVNDLYDYLNRSEDTPVGYLNASWGGTSIQSWFPKDELDKNDYLVGRLKEIGWYPTHENWNKNAMGNWQQTSAQYNVKIAPLEGVKVRSIIWYQGENETSSEFYTKLYSDYLRFYYKVYRERFAADPDNFVVLSSLIYPWTYGGSGECNLGYINDAFVRTAVEEPEKFGAAPIGDLPPRWAYHQGNHPIHPNNKYPLGSRMVSLALDKVYDRGFSQTSPAYPLSYEICGNRIRIRFASVGFGLFIDGERPVGLYVADDDGIYLPAECDIGKESGSDTMEVWCDAISEPKYCAYAVQSLEPCCNIWAGVYPIYPFFSDKVNLINIEARPWYDTSKNSFWANNIKGEVFDIFYRPIWQAEPESELCLDSAFTLEGSSVRVYSENNEFGCFVKSYPYNTLDFWRFKALSANFFNVRGGLNAKLILELEDKMIETPFTECEEIRGGWLRYEASLEAVPEGANVKKMIFRFSHDDTSYHFVNLERVRLIKK